MISLLKTLFSIASKIPSGRLLFGFSTIAILLFSSQSCVSISTWYNWADTYIRWELDSYFDLSDDQETTINERLPQLLARHKQEEVPKYIQFLNEVKQRLNRPISAADLHWFRGEINRFDRNIIELLADDVSYLLTTVTDQQLSHLEEKLKEENEEWLERHDDDEEEAEEERSERILERVENWLGDLSDEQEEQILALFPFDPARNEIRYQQRLQSQQRFLTLLRQKYPKEEIKRQLKDWLSNRQNFYSEAYKELNEKWRSETVELVLLLDQVATGKQRRHLNEELDNYINQLQDLLK